CAKAMRDTAGSAAAPAARCKNARRGSFIAPSLKWGDGGASRHHSGLMLAPRITFAHFVVSSAMSFSKAVVEPRNTVPPCSPSRALIMGSATAVLICLLSFSTISRDVLLGAPTPYHVLAS